MLVSPPTTRLLLCVMPLYNSLRQSPKIYIHSNLYKFIHSSLAFHSRKGWRAYGGGGGMKMLVEAVRMETKKLCNGTKSNLIIKRERRMENSWSYTALRRNYSTSQQENVVNTRSRYNKSITREEDKTDQPIHTTDTGTASIVEQQEITAKEKEAYTLNAAHTHNQNTVEKTPTIADTSYKHIKNTFTEQTQNLFTTAHKHDQNTLAEQTHNPTDTGGKADTHNQTWRQTKTTDQDTEKLETAKSDFELLVELEVELYRQEGANIPSKFTKMQWKELLTCETYSSRRKYLNFLFINEMKSLNKKKVKERMKLKKEEEEEEQRRKFESLPEEKRHLQYGLWKNSILLKILDSRINNFYHSKVVQSMLLGQPLVVDMQYEKSMSKRERQNCAYQIQTMMASNRSHTDPFVLELHNAAQSVDIMDRLERYVPCLHNPEFPLPIYDGSYLKKYSKERLIYLTPHCRDEMTRFDPEGVYIIGGIVDKASGQPLSLATAKKEGIRMVKFPLDRYLSWGSGSKNLTLNQTIDIMLDFRLTGDWRHALRHVPKRKIQRSETQEDKVETILNKINKRNGVKYY